ncbi:MAG: TetR/AcrR family transcriptional regulator [Myxococcales bacterium]|nr:TetR/AcrR family transcriptional regulator [Myxococcales bacterium]
MSASANETTAPRRRLPPEERRAQLLAIALDVFAERGLGAARHAEIAERADVAVSTTFVYFPTREQLVEDVLDEVARFFIERLEQAHGQEKPCVDILREVGEGFLDLLHTHRSHVLLWLEWGAAVRDEVWPRYRAFTERAVAITRRTLERGQREGAVAPDADTESLARLFASSSQSIARLQLGDVDRETIRRFQDTVLRAIVTEDALR